MSSEDILTRPVPAPDSTCSYGPDRDQFVHVRVPQGTRPHPVVFFIHGGFWRAKYDLAYAGHLCASLKQHGIATWNVEYRRTGNPGGGWPGAFEDVRSAYHALLSSQPHDTTPLLDPKRICVAGHSAGGQLALCLAAHEPGIRRVISLAGVVDLRRAWALHLSNDAVAEFLGGPPDELPDIYHEASPAELHIGAKHALLHGTTDDSVPYELSANYVQRKKQSGEDVELITFENTGHFELVDPESAVWSKVLETFRALL
ncbi:MAG TPA: alpha/beta hydrolase [Terriglobales bacterium]|nr:alpha/beta hydrolase [Terriglobales bacterium]